jgi:hypothetical protein
LLGVISKEPEAQPPQLDFEDIPKSAAEIPLERHGCLLLLAARFATDTLFSSGQTVDKIPIFPEVADIFSNFIPQSGSRSGVFDEPETLIDSLLSLTQVSLDETFEFPRDDDNFEQFLLSLTMCTRSTGFRSTGRIGRIPSTVFHKHPDARVRYNLIRRMLDDSSLQYAREPAIAWLKQEILAADTAIPDDGPTIKSSAEPPIFTDPHYFDSIFTRIFPPVPRSWLALVTTPMTTATDDEDVMSAWITFTQHLQPFYLSVLNLCYLLLKSPVLRAQLQLDRHLPYLQEEFLTPLKAFTQALCEDAEIKARIDQEVGADAEAMGRRCAELVLHLVQEIEEI